MDPGEESHIQLQQENGPEKESRKRKAVERQSRRSRLRGNRFVALRGACLLGSCLGGEGCLRLAHTCDDERGSSPLTVALPAEREDDRAAG